MSKIKILTSQKKFREKLIETATSKNDFLVRQLIEEGNFRNFPILDCITVVQEIEVEEVKKNPIFDR